MEKQAMRKHSFLVDGPRVVVPEDMGRFQTLYGPKVIVEHGNDEPSLTKQADAAECDINVLMARYEKHGVLPPTREGGEWGADVASAVEYRDALDVVRDAQDLFQALDARTRREFDNDPAAFLEFAENPKNAERMAELGLMKPESVERVRAAAAAAASAAELEPPPGSEGGREADVPAAARRRPGVHLMLTGRTDTKSVLSRLGRRFRLQEGVVDVFQKPEFFGGFWSFLGRHVA